MYIFTTLEQFDLRPEMTISFTPIKHDELCEGSRWTINDKDELARLVARVALGQYRHVENILIDLDATIPAATHSFAEDAQRKLHVAKNGDPWHRDGWLFQVISWIAASQHKPVGTVIKAPHIFHAHKGFDGMQLQIANDGRTIEAVVIFEDKATTNPRSTLRDDVWPSLALFEAGYRVTELSHEATGLLEAHQRTFPDVDVDAAIDQIVWQQARRYRVSITIDSTHSSDVQRKKLFDGYDTNVVGSSERRTAETMHFDDLRAWMTDFATRVSMEIDEACNV